MSGYIDIVYIDGDEETITYGSFAEAKSDGGRLGRAKEIKSFWRKRNSEVFINPDAVSKFTIREK